MGKKFKDKASAPPPVSIEPVSAMPVAANREPTTLAEFTDQIQTDLSIMESAGVAIKKQKDRINQARARIIQSLIKIRDNKKKYLGPRTFQSYIEEDLGMSRGHVYETMRAYELCLKYGRPELYLEGRADIKVLIEIDRIEDQKRQETLIATAENLKRDDLVRRSYKRYLDPEELKPALKELIGGLPAREKARLKKDLIKAIQQA